MPEEKHTVAAESPEDGGCALVLFSGRRQCVQCLHLQSRIGTLPKNDAEGIHSGTVTGVDGIFQWSQASNESQ